MRTTTAPNKCDQFFRVRLPRPWSRRPPDLYHICGGRGDKSTREKTAKISAVLANGEAELHCSGKDGISCYQAVCTEGRLRQIYRELKNLRWSRDDVLVMLDNQQCCFKRVDRIRPKREENKKNWKILLGFRSATNIIHRVTATLI